LKLTFLCGTRSDNIDLCGADRCAGIVGIGGLELRVSRS